MDNIFADFLLNSGLYDETPITQDNIEQLFELIEGKVKIDAYCKDCGEKRVFSVEPIYYTTERGEKTIELSLGDTLRKTKNMCLMQLNPRPGESESNGNWQFYWFTQDLEKDTRIMCFSFVCAMHDWHHLDYIVLTNNTTMKKIGQYPSVADLAFPELDEYKKSLTKEDLRELRRAIGLYSQNIGVGSFVYLMFPLTQTAARGRWMKSPMFTPIIDRFGEDVETHLHDDNSFSVVAEISASATFYSWVFTYGGKMKIVEPKVIRDEYERRLNEALKNR